VTLDRAAMKATRSAHSMLADLREPAPVERR